MKWIHIVKAALVAEDVLTKLGIKIKGITPKQFEDAIRIALTTGKTLRDVLKPEPPA